MLAMRPVTLAIARNKFQRLLVMTVFMINRYYSIAQAMKASMQPAIESFRNVYSSVLLFIQPELFSAIDIKSILFFHRDHFSFVLINILAIFCP